VAVGDVFVLLLLTAVPIRELVETLLDFINPLNAELNPICHLLALLGGAAIVVVSRLRVKGRFV
jgi:hypothetical protein